MHLMRVDIPIYVYMYVRVHACNDVYIDAHICSIYIYMCVRICTSVCVYVYCLLRSYIVCSMELCMLCQEMYTSAMYTYIYTYSASTLQLNHMPYICTKKIYNAISAHVHVRMQGACLLKP